MQLLTPQQALEDAITLVLAKQRELGCSSTDAVRCPVRCESHTFPTLIHLFIPSPLTW
jgi:hypothetical protein